MWGVGFWNGMGVEGGKPALEGQRLLPPSFFSEKGLTEHQMLCDCATKLKRTTGHRTTHPKIKQCALFQSVLLRFVLGVWQDESKVQQ